MPTRYALRRRRIRAGIRQSDIAAGLGCTTQFVCAVELAKKRAPRGFLKRYAEVLEDIAPRGRPMSSRLFLATRALTIRLAIPGFRTAPGSLNSSAALFPRSPARSRRTDAQAP